jgi:Zn-finger domain-containing protein
MEDGIERNISSLLNNEESDKTQYLYVCIPNHDNPNDLKITFDKFKAINFLKEKKYRVEIYKKNEENIYIPSYDCLYINN